MTLETRDALFLVAELLAAWRASDADTSKCWLAGDAGVQGILVEKYSVKTQESVATNNDHYC